MTRVASALSKMLAAPPAKPGGAGMTRLRTIPDRRPRARGRVPLLMAPLLAVALAGTATRAQDADAPERRFNVYFTEEDAEITPEARAVIREAKLYYDTLPGAAVEIWGHADRQGSRYYNLKLSRRRALAAAGELIAAGADRARIRTVWSGETQLPHPTDDGVPLSLNRVAIITIEKSAD